ncbi:MAG: hypothetical protein KAQ68_00660 [Clostridiales bacterium]|nr:hypothetical protein [Clostridiales bacterium]
MTPREKFIAALERRPITGRVPTFELVFYLTMEKFGRHHPRHMKFNQWGQMSEVERNLHRNYNADTLIMTAEHYGHNAIFVHPTMYAEDEVRILLELIREKTGDTYYLTMHGDSTFAIPDGDGMYEFSYRMVDEPQKLKDEAQESLGDYLERAQKLQGSGLIDGYTLCSDYCLNVGPFLSPEQFSVFIAPYLKELIEQYKNMGYYTIKHTDGNIMPIIDQLADCNPHALHSIDPQAGVDIAEVKKLYGDKICLIGNVNCGLMQTGTEEETIESARYALKHGMPNYGYIFSTSNCVYTGMDIKRYELILDVLEKEGVYPE